MIANKLLPGDTIGIVSPASPEDRNIIDKGIKYLETLGFKIKLGKSIYSKTGFLAGSDEERAMDLINMFLDPQVSMILCIRGGYGAMRILPYLDFDIIKKNPKIFMGYSDITTLLNTIYQRTGLITFHGPMVTSNLSEKYTLNSFLETITKSISPYTLNNPYYLPVECSVRGISEGCIVGGNLCLLCSTLGTPYEIDTKDKILFLEEISEAPYKIDRMLTQLNLSGKLSQCSGFILGQFKDCSLSNYNKSFTLDEILETQIFSLKKPTINHVMSGHSYPKLTIPIGAKVRIDSTLGKIVYLDPVVK